MLITVNCNKNYQQIRTFILFCHKGPGAFLDDQFQTNICNYVTIIFVCCIYLSTNVENCISNT